MIKRFSSRRASLYEEFLKPRLASAKRYDRIAGYFQSSLLELASESLADIPRIRIVCNTEVSAEDVKTVRMATGARRKELEESLLRLAWNAGNFPHLVDVHGMTIRVMAGELNRVVDAAERELAQSRRHYQRGGLIVTVVTDPGTRETRVQEISPPALVRALAGAATWERFDGRAEDWVRADPPARHATVLFDATSYPKKRS